MRVSEFRVRPGHATRHPRRPALGHINDLTLDVSGGGNDHVALLAGGHV